MVQWCVNLNGRFQITDVTLESEAKVIYIKICILAHNANSSSILTKCVHIWHNYYLAALLPCLMNWVGTLSKVGNNKAKLQCPPEVCMTWFVLHLRHF